MGLIEALAKSYDKNRLSQILSLRAYHLPDAEDTPENLARAIWLDKHQFELMSMAVNNGAAKLFPKSK
ncbi:DUF6890 family protein [Vibrio sp. S11_S32]|uniref:DUF6890 family protein n=1 Tax=Vibrio sp. S11_S32 TaxID=2720225 RepID=UPI00406C1BB1